jgi:hypothetical protein
MITRVKYTDKMKKTTTMKTFRNLRMVAYNYHRDLLVPRETQLKEAQLNTLDLARNNLQRITIIFQFN